MKPSCRFFAPLLSICVIALALSSGPATAAEIVGISKIVAHPALDAIETGIQDELTALGHDFEYDLQNANGEISTAASIATKFKSENVKAAVGIATPTAQALVNTIKDRPVIFAAVTDPVGAGLVESLDRGTGNVTGVSDMTPVRGQITFLNSLKKIERLGHVYSSHEANAVALADIARTVCKEMGIQFVETTVINSSEVKQATQTIASKVDAIYISTDNTVVSALSAVVDVAARHNIPVMSADPSSAEENEVLAAWGFDYYKMGRAAGKMIHDVLAGQAPADMPVRFMTDPSDVDLLINLDVAARLGITIPAEVLADANKIVKNGKLEKK